MPGRSSGRSSNRVSNRSLGRSSGICVLYEADELSAERMSLVEPIINKYVADNGVRLDRNAVYYLKISSAIRRRERRDYSKLKRMSRCKATVFVSQLNSTSCQYLQDLFFNSHPDSVHVSSVSTAVSLTGASNLLRYQAPDVEIERIYLYNIQNFTGNCVIVYQPGIYYEDLSQTIAVATQQAGIPTLLLLKENFDLTLINNFTTPIFNIVFVIDDPLTYVEQMRLDPAINLKSFQILISDAGVQQLTADPNLLDYLRSHSTQLLQWFVDPRQLLLAQEYEAYINDPRHPVSTNVALLFICFDLAVLVTNTQDPIHRTTYLDLYLDSNLDNMNTIYGGYTYVPSNLVVHDFYYIYSGILYVGEPQTASSSSLQSNQNTSNLNQSVSSLQSKQSTVVVSKSQAKLGLGSKILTTRLSSFDSTKTGFCHNVGLCVLYDVVGFAAERSFEVQRIINKYIADTTTKIKRYRLVFLAITGDATIDNRNLTRVRDSAKVFLSALGTGRCNYLAETFFNAHLECLHVNSFSTATTLSTIPNLARYQTPDIAIVKVYLYQIQLVTGNCVIVFEDGIYSTTLSSQIAQATVEAGIQTLRIHRNDLTSQILNTFTTNNFTIVYILGVVLTEVLKLEADPLINLKTFQILASDSAALNTTSDPSLLAYLNAHEARLIQTFVSQRQLDVSTTYNQFINNPDHPVSPILAFFLACFDWALLIINTYESHRLTRQTYQDLELDIYLNNTNNVYGAYRYIPNGLTIGTFFFIFADTLYVGIEQIE